MNLDRFPRGTILPSADQVRNLVTPGVRAVTATTDTVTADDDQNTITRSNASASTQTLPNKATAPGLELGYSVDVANLGAGGVTLAVQSGDTLVGDGDGAVIAQGCVATARIVAVSNAGARTWLIAGKLSS